MRRERLYLTDIVEAVDAIRRFLEGIEESAFLGNDLLQSAVLQKLIVIGEAASRLPSDFCDLHGEVEWRDIVAFRNIAVHAYFSVDWRIVWVAATEETIDLRERIVAILAEDFDS